MKQFVITIGRQLGSGGKEMAELLARELGVSVYDKALLQAAACESGIDASVFEQADESESSSLFGSFFSIHGSISEYFSGGSCIDNDRLFEIQSDVIRNIAQNESCIIVGRCAEYVLRDHPAMFSIFITADHADRVERVMRAEGLEREAAVEFIEKNDKKRRSYHDYYATTHWGEAGSYDLCVNVSRLGIEATVDFLKQYIQKRFS
ncbi:MAG: cytidylate kinase-like family protein [Bacteroidaceae bacterium]|nr:cytidylate kinase-like family protein [Bacteroidaceae bacterium]